MIELDNTCAFEGARKLHAKAADLQELLRQLYELCSRFSIPQYGCTRHNKQHARGGRESGERGKSAAFRVFT